ncbi:hypothetical protein BD779DRAFT_1672454 [Infundibulicybe gibba]|nr:hypothetical protein BD779DRAFT_1672454 [Infundibulicybe gibba]
MTVERPALTTSVLKLFRNNRTLTLVYRLTGNTFPTANLLDSIIDRLSHLANTTVTQPQIFHVKFSSQVPITLKISSQDGINSMPRLKFPPAAHGEHRFISSNADFCSTYACHAKQRTPPVASLTFLVYDMILTLDNEIGFIWKKPNSSWIKWQFLFTRYFTLASQICNCSINFTIVSSSLDLRLLRGWYMSQAVVSDIIVTTVEVLLMLQLYVLYNKSTKLVAAFCIIIFAETAALVIGIVFNLPGEEFNLVSILDATHDAFTYLGFSSMVSQTVIVILTWVKYREAVHGGWSASPIISLIIRDVTAIFCMIFVTCLGIAVLTMLDSQYAPMGYFWFLSIVSSSGCRLIINLQTLAAASEAREPSTTVWLSTVLPEPSPASYAPGDSRFDGC